MFDEAVMDEPVTGVAQDEHLDYFEHDDSDELDDFDETMLDMDEDEDSAEIVQLARW